MHPFTASAEVDVDDARTAPRIDRLTAADLMLVLPEKMGWHQDIGALAILDGERLTDDRGRVDLARARAHVESRLPRVPRFRQVMRSPAVGLGWPYWVDAPSFDVGQHVDAVRVAPPAGDAEVLATCEALWRHPLPPERPLWDMHVLEGLPDRRIGLLMRMHHAIADGVAGVATLTAFVDAVAEPPPTIPARWSPSPPPSTRDLLADNARRRVSEVERALRAVWTPIRTLRSWRSAWPGVRELFAEGRAPRTSVNRRIGSDRTFAIVRGDLERIRTVAHCHRGTVNDVLLAAVAGGYRTLLRNRDEDVETLALRAFVPVSMHDEHDTQAVGNADAGMLVPLPLAGDDADRRLDTIAADTVIRRAKPRPEAGSLFRNSLVQRAFLRLMPRQRFMNAYVANVPGPPATLYFAGARLLELFPIVPITANVSIGVGALSYAGQFNIGVVADPNVCPDCDRFVDGVRDALGALDAAE